MSAGASGGEADDEDDSYDTAGHGRDDDDRTHAGDARSRRRSWTGTRTRWCRSRGGVGGSDDGDYDDDDDDDDIEEETDGGEDILMVTRRVFLVLGADGELRR